MNLAFKSRLEADYEKHKLFEQGDAKEALVEAKEFVNEIEKFIEKTIG